MRTKSEIFLMIFLLFANASYSQTVAVKKTTLQKVFDNIVNAYGNAKAPPSLEFVIKRSSEGYPASYQSTPQPLIKIEEQVFDICMNMNGDSLNALSIIIGHELAHYYNDHTWCNDYSYAIRNTPLGKAIKNQSRGDQLAYETQADNNAFYYSCIAGYNPFGIYDKLIDHVYSVYKLPTTVKGYPSKEERKMIAKRAQKKIRELYPVYDGGLLLLYLDQPAAAESCFDYLAKYFPSREIYNNLGTAKFLYALSLKPYDTLNFIYPIDVDPVSRLDQNGTRGLDESYISILKDAKKQFEKALILDPSYIDSYINLACVNDALGNYQMALGNVNEGEQLNKDLGKLKHIKAIAQYHSGSYDIAETTLQSLARKDSAASFNYRLLLIAKSTGGNDIAIAKFRDNAVTSLINDTALLQNCPPAPKMIFKKERSETRVNERLAIISENDGTRLQIRIDLAGKIIEAMITNEQKASNEIEAGSFKFIKPGYGCLLFIGSFIKSISYKVK